MSCFTNPYSLYSHSDLLVELVQLIQDLSPLWRFRSFDCHNLPWARNFPNLATRVLQLDDSQLDNIDICQQKLLEALLSALIQDLQHQAWEDDRLEKLQQLLAISLPVKQIDDTPLLDEHDVAHFSAHIKGRKWSQISKFIAVLPKEVRNMPTLEWCAGKGHLGRLISKSWNLPVTSLEWQSKLCEDGEHFAHRWQLPQTFICGDAFNPIDSCLWENKHAVALHACGDLHVSLLKHAVKYGLEAISISPCCYHLIQTDHYQPLSQIAKANPMWLTRQQLQLPLQQSLIASDSDNIRRLKEMAWRLGFDALQRSICGINEYLPTPAIKNSQLSKNFKYYCDEVARLKKIELPKNWNANDWELTGWQRLPLIRRLDLVSHLLRAPMEHYLLLDRVCYLQEQGYQVDIQAFCSTDITPRNALICALKQVS